MFPPVVSAGTHIASFCVESVRRASSGHAPASKKKRVATHVRWVLHAGHDPTGLSTIDVELGRRRFARAASARSMARCGPSVNDGTQTRARITQGVVEIQHTHTREGRVSIERLDESSWKGALMSMRRAGTRARK